MKSQRERIKLLLTDTIALLCRNGLSFENELRVQAVIGITADKEESFVVHINKCFERNAAQQEDIKCENEEQINDCLQHVAGKLEQAEAELSQEQTANCSSHDMQPTREAPPCPSQESSHRTKTSNLSAREDPPCLNQESSHRTKTPIMSNYSQQNSQHHQKQMSANTLSYNNCASSKGDMHASKSDVPMSKTGSSRYQSLNNCAESNSSKIQTKVTNSPIYVESDDCDDSDVDSASQVCQQPSFQQPSAANAQADCKQRSASGAVMQQGQQYKSSPQYRSNHRYSVDGGLRRADKMSNLCQDLYEADEDDACGDLNADQQYSRSRGSQAEWQQQPQDVVFDPCYSPTAGTRSRQDAKAVTTQQRYRDSCQPSSLPVRYRRTMALASSRRCNDSARKPNTYEKVTITRFVCNDCQLSFNHQSSLLTHQVRKHGRPKNERRGRPSAKMDTGNDDWC